MFETIEASQAKLNANEVAKAMSATLELAQFGVGGFQNSLKVVGVGEKDEVKFVKMMVVPAMLGKAKQAKGRFLDGRQPQAVGVGVVPPPSSPLQSRANFSLRCCLGQIEAHAQTT